MSSLSLCLVIGALLLTTGCGNSESEATADEHHLEHFIPHHKPANFAESVEEIERRCSDLAAHAAHRHHDEADEFQELLDIIDWIPELAADSDLNEAGWNQAAGAGQTIAAQLATRRSADGTLNLEGLPEAIAAEVKVLQKLIPQAGTPEAAIEHEHEHDEHEHKHEH